MAIDETLSIRDSFNDCSDVPPMISLNNMHVGINLQNTEEERYCPGLYLQNGQEASHVSSSDINSPAKSGEWQGAEFYDIISRYCSVSITADSATYCSKEWRKCTAAAAERLSDRHPEAYSAPCQIQIDKNRILLFRSQVMTDSEPIDYTPVTEHRKSRKRTR